MVTILFLNLEHGGYKYPLQEISDLIRNTRTDMAVFCESMQYVGKNPHVDAAKKIAALTGGWYSILFPASQISFVSRWPIMSVADNLVLVDAPNRIPFLMYGVHFQDFPYQPFQSQNIPYCYDKSCQVATQSASVLEREAFETRGADSLKIASIASNFAQKMPIVIAGDFNEPSHLDWTNKAVRHGIVPLAVDYPSSRIFLDSGFKDIWREIYQDEVRHRGNTWPAYPPRYKYREDRIDFIYARKQDIITYVRLYDTSSDHRAIIAKLKFVENDVQHNVINSTT